MQRPPSQSGQPRRAATFLALDDSERPHNACGRSYVKPAIFTDHAARARRFSQREHSRVSATKNGPFLGPTQTFRMCNRKIQSVTPCSRNISRVIPHLQSPEGRNTFSFRSILFYIYLEFRNMEKVQKPSDSVTRMEIFLQISTTF
jgi:hypothetical protein